MPVTKLPLPMARRTTAAFFIAALLLALLVAAPAGGAASAGPVPAGLSAADWAAIRAQLPAPAVPVQSGYLKASNAEAFDEFGATVAVDEEAAGGPTVVVGAPQEAGNGTSEGDNSAARAGAVYIFVRSGASWSQQAYLKASNAEANDNFGWSVGVDGDTIVVGAPYEDSNGTGQGDNSAARAGAAYVFVRSGATWSQQAYLKASNAEAGDNFGESVAVDGDTIVAGAEGEAGNGTGQSNNSAVVAGAAYVFIRSGASWSQQAYLKASNAEAYDHFGDTVAVDGDTIVAGAEGEAGNGTGQSDNSAEGAGAAYVFVRSGASWSQQAYLKASNAEARNAFGDSVAVDGDTIVAGAPGENSDGTGQNDNSAVGAGAAYVFVRNGAIWSQQAYLKASNPGVYDSFGYSVAVDEDATGDPTVVAGAYSEDGNGTGQGNNSAEGAGAAYVFVRNGASWSQQAYLKASNVEATDWFGISVAVDGGTIVVGAPYEDGNGTGQGDNSASKAGAAYVFEEPTGTIIIQKEATPEDDTPFNFNEDIPGANSGFTLTDPNNNIEQFDDVPTGSYEVTEILPLGWSLDSIACVDPDNGSTTGGATATIDLDVGETVTCTFNNSRDTGTITIVKAATPEDNTPFTFTENIPGAGSGFTLSDPGDTTETFSNVPIGSYQVTELAEPGWTLDDITCIDPDNGSSDAAPTATIDLDDDETVTCTFGNSRDTGTITIVKVATPEDNTPFTFTETIPGAGSGFTLSDPADNTETFSNVPTGSYSVVENTPAGWLLEGLDCDDVNSTESLATATATINLEKGETVTCTFSNSQLPPTTAGIYVSAVSAGNTGDGLAFGPHDILLWDNAWTKWFDGTAAQLKPNGNAVHNINALWIPDTAGDDVVLAFAQDARAVPGVSGKVDGTDLVWWNGSAFALWFDGQDVGLSVLAKEKIDALHVLDGSLSPIGGSCQYYLLISTAGDGKVPNHSGGEIKFDGSDVLGFCMTNSGANTAGFWHRVLNGKAEGMPGQALVNLSASDDGQVLYLTTKGAFNVDSAHGSHSMVYRYDRGSGQFSGPYFSAPAEGLNRPVDGLHVDGQLP